MKIMKKKSSPVRQSSARSSASVARLSRVSSSRSGASLWFRGPSALEQVRVQERALQELAWLESVR